MNNPKYRKEIIAKLISRVLYSKEKLTLSYISMYRDFSRLKFKRMTTEVEVNVLHEEGHYMEYIVEGVPTDTVKEAVELISEKLMRYKNDNS